MGPLNSKVMGAIARAYGDNSVYPSPELLTAARMTIDADRYRRVFRSHSKSFVPGAGKSAVIYDFRPGPEVAWLVHSGNVLNGMTADLMNIIVSIVDPENVVEGQRIGQYINMEPGLIGLFIPTFDISGLTRSMSGGRVFIPSGFELRIQLNAVTAPFEVVPQQVSIYVEEVPPQQEFSTLEPFKITEV